MYAIYDLKESEMCVGIFEHCKGVAEYFGTSQNAIYTNISRGTKRAGRYKIVSVKE